MNDGYPEHVSLYDVCVGMALVSGEAREALKGKDALFEQIHAFGEGKAGEEWKSLIRNLLGQEDHPAVADRQGDWAVGKRRFSRLFHALIHRLKSIGGYRSLKLAQQKAACIQRVLSVAMSKESTTELQELINLIAPTNAPSSSGAPLSSASNGSLTHGDGTDARKVTYSEVTASLESMSQEPDAS